MKAFIQDIIDGVKFFNKFPELQDDLRSNVILEWWSEHFFDKRFIKFFWILPKFGIPVEYYDLLVTFQFSNSIEMGGSHGLKVKDGKISYGVSRKFTMITLVIFLIIYVLFLAKLALDPKFTEVSLLFFPMFLPAGFFIPMLIFVPIIVRLKWDPKFNPYYLIAIIFSLLYSLFSMLVVLIKPSIGDITMSYRIVILIVFLIVQISFFVVSYAYSLKWTISVLKGYASR